MNGKGKKDLIINKIEGVNMQSLDPESNPSNTYVTKEGKSYKDFSGLMWFYSISEEIEIKYDIYTDLKIYFYNGK
jgi:hypothetical protein